MERLLNYLDGPYTEVAVNFDNRDWATDAEIPTTAGWYFLSTTAPIEALLNCPLWQDTYTRERDNKEAQVRNYDISERAERYEENAPLYWNLQKVYSGLTSSLRSRAREHTFANPGTASLALSRYPALHNHSWKFNYLELQHFPHVNEVSDSIILKLGEQAWRVKFGWPILCEA